MTDQNSIVRNLANLRNVPLEVFECRHCAAETISSDEYEIATQLCKKCFDARAVYRRSNPTDLEGKAELHWSSNKHGEKRSGRTLICAGCSGRYAIVPLSFKDPTDADIAEWRTQFDKMELAREQNRNVSPNFKYESFDYTNAPKGWTNEILCKNCFDKLPEECALEKERQKEEATPTLVAANLPTTNQAAPKQVEQTESLAQITKENPIGAIAAFIAVAASIIALWKFLFIGVSEDFSAAGKASPYGEILFYAICVLFYLFMIPILREKGGLLREISTVMSWIAGIVFIAVVASNFPSCNNTSHMPDDPPYYRK